MSEQEIGANVLAPIPWERYSGEAVENVLATYICRLRPLAVRIRPSRGDHGIDLIEKHADGTVTIYQIKKFATNLNASQKQKIKRSLGDMLDYVKDNNYELRAWHLVLPLDPTLENLEWFYGLATNPSFTMVWDGLTRIDGWAAQMPEVADYCLNANNEWTMEVARLHLETLDIESDEGRNRLNQRLNAIQETLEKTAPYYRYGVYLIPENTSEADIKELLVTPGHRAGLLATQAYMQPGLGMIQIDVYARSAALTELHPIKGRITLLPGDDDQRNQVEEFVNYGVPIKSCPARIVETSGPFAAKTLEGDGVGDLCMLTHEVQQPSPELFLTTADGCELAMFRISRTSGERDVQTVFSDETRMVSLTLRADFEGDIACTPTITTEGIEGKDCSAVYNSLRFLRAAYKNGKASVLFDNKLISVWTLGHNEDVTRSIDALHELAGAVMAIGRCAHIRLPFPEIGNMTEAQHSEILSKGKLADGRCIVKRWHDALFKMVSYKEMNLEFPAIIKWLRPERITIGGIDCDLGCSEHIIVAGAVQQDAGDDAFKFLPRDGKDDVCVTHLLPARSVATGMVNQVYSTAYQADIWDDTLQFAGCNQMDTSYQS